VNLFKFKSKKEKRNNKLLHTQKNFTYGKNTILLNELTIRNPYQNKITIGDDCMINCNFIFESDKGEIEIGDRCFINAGTNIISRSKIKFGNDITVAWGCTFYDHNSHSFDWKERANDIRQQTKDYLECGDFIKNKNWDVVKSRPITIEDKAWIGMNCTILNGVTIGEGAIVGACSVVRENVEPWTVVAGNPAKVIKRLKHE
jgi:galactoside O-acetyltransferase